jgi:hypothetical protein
MKRRIVKDQGQRVDELCDLVRDLRYALYISRYAIAHCAIEDKAPADPTGKSWADWLEEIGMLRDRARKTLEG